MINKSSLIAWISSNGELEISFRYWASGDPIFCALVSEEAAYAGKVPFYGKLRFEPDLFSKCSLKSLSTMEMEA